MKTDSKKIIIVAAVLILIAAGIAYAVVTNKEKQSESTVYESGAYDEITIIDEKGIEKYHYNGECNVEFDSDGRTIWITRDSGSTKAVNYEPTDKVILKNYENKVVNGNG